MRKIIIVLIIIILIIIIGAILKDFNVTDSFDFGRNSRFRNPQGYSTTGTTEIVIDTETGVMYLWIENSYKAGLTIMVDAEGKPLLWKGEE